MATIVKYTAKQKASLIDAGWNGTGKGSAAVRAIKMVRPICAECQGKGLDTPKGWWKDCEHEPFWSMKPKVIKTPIYDVDADGDTILTNTEIRTKMIRVPNITEVIQSPRSNDGRGPEKMKAKGFAFMEEVGLAPMCENYGCGRTWPTVATDWGVYCTELHAKLCVADALEIKFTINNQNIYRTELAGVNI